MDVITERIIYSYAGGNKTPKIKAPKIKSPKVKTPKVKTEKIKESKVKLAKDKKSHSEKGRFFKKLFGNRAERKAKRNAKKLLKKKDASGKDNFFFPLSRLKKESQKIVKTEQDGTQTVIPQQQIVQAPNGDIFDKIEISKATSMPLNLINSNSITALITFLPNTSSFSNLTSTNSIPTIKVKEGNFVETEDGEMYLKDDVDSMESENNGSNKTLKIVGISLGVLLVGGTIAYLIHKNN